MLYPCRITHHRFLPIVHRFCYDVLYILVDLEAMPNQPLMRTNRFSLLSFYERDHGGHTATGLKSWAVQQCAEQLSVAINRVQLLCLPRFLGFVFNPISVFYCFEGTLLKAVIYEVRNAYKQQHCYVALAGNQPHQFQKVFYVSPYMPLDCQYSIRTRKPGLSVGLTIHQTHKNQAFFMASSYGRARACTRTNILKYAALYFLGSQKVWVRILWHALRLRLKGLAFKKPA
jgi:uncharacterized protein